MMSAIAVATALTVAGPALALEPAVYECTVTSFADDSRYPLDEEAIARATSMGIVIIDAGYEVVVETTYPGSETDRAPLPVTRRQLEGFVAHVSDDEYFEHTVALARTSDVDGETYTGTLVYQTYETGHLWTFTCIVRP